MKYLIILVTLAACGDNIKPDLDKSPDDTVDVEPVNPYDPQPDAGITPDAPVDAQEVKSACCIGALNGKVPHECGPPPGTCKFDSICEGTILYLCTP